MKNYNEIDNCDMANLTYYIETMFDVLPIMDEQDLTFVKNRLRHINEILEDEQDEKIENMAIR